MQGQERASGAWLLTDIEGRFGLHGGCGRSYDAPAEDEQAQPCGRSNLGDDEITWHLEDQVPQGKDACSSCLSRCCIDQPAWLSAPPQRACAPVRSCIYPACVSAQEYDFSEETAKQRVWQICSLACAESILCIGQMQVAPELQGPIGNIGPVYVRQARLHGMKESASCGGLCAQVLKRLMHNACWCHLRSTC